MLPLREGYLHKLFGILLHGRLFCPIYLLNHLLKAVWAREYFGYNPVLLCFAQIVPPLAVGNSFSRLLYPFDVPPLFCVCVGGGLFTHLSTFLLSSTTRYSGLILYIFTLHPRISHFSKEPWFLLLERGIKNQDLGSRCAHCSEVPFGS